jgi:hypothetical protein
VYIYSTEFCENPGGGSGDRGGGNDCNRIHIVTWDVRSVLGEGC